jgi:VWFA-related protein
MKRSARGVLLCTIAALTVVPPDVPVAARAAQATTQAAPPAAEQPQEMPRFRAGANLVRLDAYVSQDGAAVTDLKPEDFELLEDNVPQKIESFELIRPRPAAPEGSRVEPTSVRDSRMMATDPDARVFVLFMDLWHVHLEGSYKAQNPIANLLNQMIGQDDLVGVMTPEMSASNVTLARKTKTIEGILRNNWFWGERERLTTPDPAENDIRMCYPTTMNTARDNDTAQQIIERRRERKTLDAMEDLIVHLEGIREERKFVIMLSEGWIFPSRDDRLARRLNSDDPLPGVNKIGVGPDGKLRQGDPYDNRQYETCERERLRAAADDMQTDYRFLLQRANRSNVSFYTLDPRGLVAFDENPVATRDFDPERDRQRLGTRQNALRELAETTDGIAILNTNNFEPGLRRMVADVGSYYLLGYYSTNTRLDGRFRKLTLRVKRPGVQVRSRPGYLAPTQAEFDSARAAAAKSAPGASATPVEHRRALERLAPARGSVPVRVHAVAGAGRIHATIELDSATVKEPEWEKGGRATLTIEHERGAAPPIEVKVPIEAGQRMFTVTEPTGSTLPAGRYVLKLSLTPTGSSLPVQTTTDVVVAEGALIGQSGLLLRRGPSTGIAYVQTADARFRRTERIRLEVPRFIADGTVTARLLSRDGQQLPLVVTVTERVDETSKTTFIVADVTLAALAQGEFLIEVTIEKDGKKERAAYAFRVVP